MKADDYSMDDDDDDDDMISIPSPINFPNSSPQQIHHHSANQLINDES